MMKLGGKLLVLIAVLVCIAVVSTGYAIFVTQTLQNERETGKSITVLDDMGRIVHIGKVERIISTSPSNTEILFAIGAGHLVVGVDNYSDYPSEAVNITKVGDFISLNVERIVSLQPDVVFAYYGQKEGIERLEALGISVVTFHAETLNDTFHDIQLAGYICGKTENATNLVAQLQQRVEDIRSKTQQLNDSQHPRVYYELWNNPYMSAGPGSYINDLIRIAGGTNIAANASKDYPILSEEFILSANPDIIITSSMNIDSPEKIMQRAGWQEINAVKNHSVYMIDDNLVSRPGPRIVEGLETLAKIIHPEIFGN
jgi:iron complex transport system substrate-binding protein